MSDQIKEKIIEFSYVGTIKKEDYERLYKQVNQYFECWNHTKLDRLEGDWELHFDGNTCVLDRSYKEIFHPSECINPKGIISLLILSSNEEKVEKLKKDISQIFE